MFRVIALVLHWGSTSNWTKLVVVVSLVVWLVVTVDWDSLVARLQLLRLVRRAIEAKFRIICCLIVLCYGLHTKMLLDKLNCLRVNFRLQYFSCIWTLNQSFSLFLCKSRNIRYSN